MKSAVAASKLLALILAVSAGASAQQGAAASVNPVSVPLVAGFPLPGAANASEYLGINDDASLLEKAIEADLNRAGIRASTATGNNGAIHFTLVGFTGTSGMPNMQYRISGLPPVSDSGRPKTQFIVISFSTSVRVNQANEQLYAALDEANKVGNCAWHIDGGEVRCRAWLQIPAPGNPIPTAMVRDKILLINHDWLKFSPQIQTALK